MNQAPTMKFSIKARCILFVAVLILGNALTNVAAQSLPSREDCVSLTGDYKGKMVGFIQVPCYLTIKCNPKTYEITGKGEYDFAPLSGWENATIKKGTLEKDKVVLTVYFHGGPLWGTTITYTLTREGEILKGYGEKSKGGASVTLTLRKRN